MATDLWLLDLDAEAGGEAAGREAAGGGPSGSATASIPAEIPADTPVDTPADHAWLDDAERARAAALVDAAERRRYVTAHVALRRLLGEALGAEPGEVSILRAPCASCGRPHGRPVVVGGPWFSLSRSGPWAVIAVDSDSPVGVDVEVRQAAGRLEPLRSQVVAAGETSDDLLKTWVRKEAYLKATGEGLTRSMTTVGADELAWVVDLELPDGLVGALATGLPSANQVLGHGHGSARADRSVAG